MLSELSFRVQPLPRIVFSVDAAADLARHVSGCGKDRALIVTDKRLVGAGLVAPLIELLESDGIEVTVFDGVEANPTDKNIAAGVEALHTLGDAAVVALGGGSSMDAAKAIALMAPNGGVVSDYGFGCKPEKPGHPVVAVPTTAGTGSETNLVAVITDTRQGRKLYVAHPSVQPKVAVLDPKLTVGLPKYVTATCGFDVLTHAMEAFTSRVANPYAGGVALGAIRMAWEHLPRAYENGADIEARSHMLLASAMAAIAFNMVGLGAAHGTGHPISARFNAAHGQTLATMLPHVMVFNMDACEAKYAEVAVAMGVAKPGTPDASAARAAIDALIQLRGSLGLDRSLEDMGVNAADIPLLVEDALADLTMQTNAKKISAESATGLYQAALADNLRSRS